MTSRTLFAELVDASATAGSTRSRTAKVTVLADLLRRLDPDEVEPAVGFLVADPRQGTLGVGWAAIGGVDALPADEPTLTLHDIDELLTRLRSTTGGGSVASRAALLSGVAERATAPELHFLRRLLLGELRQGANEGIVAEAVARAAAVPAATVRRAWMLTGDLRRTASVALRAVALGTSGEAALDAMGLEVGVGLAPMLASTAPGVAAALSDLGEASVEWKLDGARVQVHRDGASVRVFTRSLKDITARLPEVVDVARSLPVRSVVLDGEVVGFAEEPEVAPGAVARPVAFQDTMSGFGRDDSTSRSVALVPWFFDVLHHDGVDLLDRPLRERLAVLEAVAGARRVPGVVTSDPEVAQAFFERAVESGHEGVMVKAIDSPYEAGRRGKAWRKVKPVTTLDLVVLAAEWGHGRRQGWLSNLHLGARDPEQPGHFVMVGKTFKGLTDALLTWQTAELLAREERRAGITVHVRPELVVEIALDGAQASVRYPGGVALRFARVKAYRADKAAAEADTIDAVRALLPGRPPA